MCDLQGSTHNKTDRLTEVATLRTPQGAERMRAVRRWSALAVLSLALAVITMDMTILNVALPHITAVLGATGTEQLWIVDIYSLILAGLLVPMSALADRYGRKRILLLGLLAFGVASIAILAADTAAVVIVLRALLGAAGAMIIPTTLSMVRVIFIDPAERGTALGIWAAVASAAAALGPLVGGVLLQHFSWQAAFLINAPLMGIALLAATMLLPEFRVPEPPQWDVPGVAASLVGMVTLVWSIKMFAAHGAADIAAWCGLGAALLTLTWFSMRCLRRPNPILELRLFTGGPFSAGILATFGSVFAISALLLLMTQWLELVQGLSPLHAGIGLLPGTIVMGVVSPFAPALANRIGTRTVLGAGLLLSGAGFLTIYLAPSPLSYGWVAVALVVLGCGAGSLAAGSAIIMSGSDPDQAGSAATLGEMSYELGSVLGVAVLGSTAAMIYRSHFDGAALPAGLSASQVISARESVSGAMHVAAQTGASDIAAHASKAFVDALSQTSLIGFCMLLVVAAATTFLVPRHYSIAEENAD